MSEVNRTAEDLISELKNIINRFQNEKREDVAISLNNHDNSTEGTNRMIRSNNDNITDLRSKLLNSKDPDQQANLRNQIDDLTNQNIGLSDYLTTVSDARDQAMDILNQSFQDEGETYDRRSALVDSLSEIHLDRI
jgi:predicted  nucleic acid-binding Zn-ribbon protein